MGSVGNELIDRAAGALIKWAISNLGTNDKPALITGIVIISLLIGALLGALSLKRAWTGPAGFAAFGIVGGVAGLRDTQNNAGIVVLAAVLATAAGIVTLRWLLRIVVTGHGLSPVNPETPVNPHASRREFFAWAGSIGAFAAVGVYGGRQLANRSAAEAARQKVSLPAAKDNPVRPADQGSGLEGLSPYITPNNTFYRIDTALVTPQVDPAAWTLQVTGMVDRPFELSFQQLLNTPMVKETVTLSCVSNEVGGDLVGNAEWQGVPLKDLLDQAGVQPGATQVVGTSVDGFTAGFPTAAIYDGRVALVAVGMNGEPLPVNHGFPVRLVVAGLYGYVSAVKWLKEIRLTRWEDFNGYWIDKGWSKEGPVKTQCRIDVPRTSTGIRPGRIAIAGVAWAPTRGIQKVEVRVDDGPWTEAKLLDVVSDNTWRQWMAEYDATSGLHQITARATDGTGETQIAEYSSPEPNGATGYPTRRIRVDG